MDKLTPNLTESQIKANIDALKRQGVPDDKIQAYVNNYKRDAVGNFTLAKEPTFDPVGAVKGAVSSVPVLGAMKGAADLAQAGGWSFNPITNLKKIGTAFKGALDQSKQGLDQIREANKQGGTQGFIRGLEGGVKTVAGGVNALFSPMTPVLAPLEKATNAIAGWTGDMPAIQKFAMGDGGKMTARVVEDVANVNALAGAGLAVGELPTQVLNTKASAGEMYKAITTKTPEEVNMYITEKFEKGIRPSVAGKNNNAQLTSYSNKAIDAVKTIVENKDNLKLVNDYGESVGGLPQNLKQFSDAIAQTKKSIFKEYNAMQEQAGQAEATVDLTPAVDELRVIEHNQIVQDLHPEVAQYAQKRADALSSRGAYTPEMTQDAIASLNNSLDAFYKNPSYETASKAQVDVMIVNKLREGLDTTISGISGEGYQALKNKYGALSTIEKDVVHRAVVDARKNVKGLIDFTDIGTGAEVIHGLVSMNPSAIAAGIFGKALAEFYKWMNSPNTAVKQMFKTAEKYGQSEPNSPLPPTSILKPALPNPNMPSPESQPVTKPTKVYTAEPMAGSTPKVLPQPFKGYSDLSTTILEKLKGKTTVSKQFISDLTNMPELKQFERDITRKMLESEGTTVNVAEFANKIKAELLPLKRISDKGRYENISLSPELRGDVKNYSEHIYESPIKTSAGNTHFSTEPIKGGDFGSSNYFGHTRVEDMANGTRRIIEVQSDLYQKGNLEKQKSNEMLTAEVLDRRRQEGLPTYDKNGNESLFNKADAEKRVAELNKLGQYNDPTAHYRMVREEIKQAALDKKTKLQFPTGETAMKIEGLGENVQFYNGVNTRLPKITPQELKVGKTVYQNGDSQWVVTDVLGDGKFKAVQKIHYDAYKKILDEGRTPTRDVSESFDISGKVDTSNPIYKFYEKDLGKYLINKYKAKTIVDDKGVKWFEVEVKPEYAKEPVIAQAKQTIMRA